LQIASMIADPPRFSAFDDGFAELQCHRDPAKRGILADIGGAQRVAAAGDEATGLVGGRPQHRRDLRRSTLHDELDIAVFGPVAADSRLDHLFRRSCHADRAHVAGRMCAYIADGIDDFGAEDR